MLLLITGFANPVKATEFLTNYVYLNGTRYYTNINDGATPAFSTVTLGSFDRGTGNLTLGGESNTQETGNDEVLAVQLFYRVYLQGTAPGTFATLTLNLAGPGTGPGGRTKRWINTTSNPNLLAATGGPGVYVLELFFQAAYNTGGGNSTTAFMFDNNGGANYTTTFTVVGSVPSQWTGAFSDNWFDSRNWSTGEVPNSTTDVTIAFFASGAFPYPTIRDNRDIQNNVVPAQVRTLRILGNNGALGARNFLSGGELQVYGDFQDPNGGFGQSGGVFTLAGGTQTFDGAVFTNIRIQGGGTKILTNRMDVLSSLSFVGLGGVISTRTDNPLIYSVDLGSNASILGETETSFVLGLLRAQRFVNSGQTVSFGNIGVDLSTTGAAPRITLATRLTGYVYNGVPPSISVKRSFTFSPENDNVQSYNIAFHYLDSEVNGIAEEDLVLFRSLTGGIPFVPLFRTDLDAVNNIVTRNGIEGTLAATFTLGDRRVPLPVRLTKFTATAHSGDALLKWTTAQELNSKGFEVQASTDGKTFQKIGFVASATPNSSSERSYEYRDAGAKKYGTRYYRLRQLDLDGQETFYGPQVVTFGKSAEATVQGYPNPFTSEVNLTLETVAAGRATVRLLDGLGREVRAWQPILSQGSSSYQLPGLDALPRGIYMVQVHYTGGKTERLKLVKE